MQWNPATFGANWSAPENAPPFWVIFGIFFPAVTGFTQGVSMSGDLKDPGKSLPAGTFMAVGISILVYFAVAIIFAGVLTNQEMMTDYQSIKQVARYGFLIDAGVIAATLSSAMASFLGGPRILQSLASDRIFPVLTPFAKGSGPAGNPRRAVLLTAAIALGVVGLGQLNLVARLVSMFFLISYGLLNYATYYEAQAASPSFRPRFRWFNKYLSLLGFLVCLAVILALDVKNGVIALAILLAIHQYLKRTAGPSRWADSSRDHALQEIRRQLLAAAREPDHYRSWRPHILAFTNNAPRRIPLLTFARWIEGSSGLVTAVRIIEGSAARRHKLLQEARETLRKDIVEHQFAAFPLVLRTDDAATALPILLQTYGVGPVRANVVLTNWYGQSGTGLPGLQALKFGRNLKSAFRLGYNLVVLYFDAEKWRSAFDAGHDGRRIDVWWCADASSRLMLLFAYLMTRHETWQKADIRVLTAGTGQRLSQARAGMIQMLEESRIDAQPRIVPTLDAETIKAESRDSSLVFLPFKFQNYNLTDRQGKSLQRILPHLPPAALVMAAEDIDLDAEPEEGTAGALAAAMDRLQEAERRLAMAEKAAAQTRHEAEAVGHQIAEARNNPADPESLEALEKRMTQTEQQAQDAFRRAAKAKAKADDAADVVIQLGGIVGFEHR
jgi:hypothetical protein